MANGESIFDILAPRQTQTGFRGALTGGIRDLSEFFQQATPSLLAAPATEDVGFGETFAAGLLGGLGAPSRRRQAEEERRREEALQFLPSIFGSLTPESQQQVVGALAPGLELQPPGVEPSLAQEELTKRFGEIAANEDEPLENRVNALNSLVSMDPKLAEAFDQSILTAGKPPDSGQRMAFVRAMEDQYTGKSLINYLNKLPPGADLFSGDQSLLKERPGDQQKLIPSQIRDLRSLKDTTAVEAEQERSAQAGKPLSFAEAASNIGITGPRLAALSAFNGVLGSDPNVITWAEQYNINKRQAMDDMGLDLSKFGTLDPKVADNVIQKAIIMTKADMAGLSAEGIPVQGPSPGSIRQPGGLFQVPQVPAITTPPPGGAVTEQQALEEVRRRQAAGDNRPLSEIMLDVRAGR